MACCIGLLLFASCKKDPVKPTISIIKGTEQEEIFSGDPIEVEFTAKGENLTKIELTASQSGTILYRDAETIENADEYYYTKTFTLDANGVVTIKGTVTDAQGNTASIDFPITLNEKPCSRFLGRYEGNALVTGTLHANIVGMDPIDQEFTDRETPIVLELEAGNNINEVVGTCTFEDRTADCRGTVEGNVVTFEAINDVITFDYDLGGFTVSPQLNVTYIIKGTLDNGQLALEGTCSGGGNINLFIYNGTVDMDAIVGGSLDKMY